MTPSCCHVHSNHSSSTHHPYMHLTRQSINQFTCAHQFRFNRCGRVGKNPALCLPCASFRCNAGWCSIFITPTWPALKQQNCDSIFQSPGVKSPFISRPVIKVVHGEDPSTVEHCMRGLAVVHFIQSEAGLGVTYEMLHWLVQPEESCWILHRDKYCGMCFAE